jgi:hypothetical protein
VGRCELRSERSAAAEWAPAAATLRRRERRFEPAAVSGIGFATAWAEGISTMRNIMMVALLAGCSAQLEDAHSGATESRSALTRPRPCHDAGLPEPAAEVCLFGEVFSDIRSAEAISLDGEVWIRTVDGLSELAGAQLLRAVQQSSHTDVTTPAEALERVDQQEVRRIDFRARDGGEAFVVYEYGVGDNSYGAFFRSGSAEIVAAIHDGDLLECTVLAPAR